MELSALLERTLAGLGYEFVDLERGQHGLLRVFIDKPEGIAVDDCARVSNQLTRLFAVEGIDFDRLEVSSPGLDRPLTRLKDYSRFAGSRAKVKLAEAVEGRKRFVGRIVDVADSRVRFVIDDDGKTETELTLALADIERARLVPEI